MSAAIPRTVAVDLTPIRPGGENGGAKPATIGLLRALAAAVPATRFVLLTSGPNHDELEKLEAENVRRFRIDAPSIERSPAENLAWRAHTALSAILPRAAIDALATVYRRLQAVRETRGLPRQLGADLLLCPFLNPYYDDGVTPLVGIIADLQFREMPDCFEADVRERLEREFTHLARRAARMVCISEAVRDSVIRNGIDGERLVVIPWAFHQRLATAAVNPAVLARWGLTPGGYLLYPANFWLHKNHRTLIQALARVDSRVYLVLTGGGGPEQRRIEGEVRAADLQDRVVFAGFVSDDELASLLGAARALVFPSLYEGFGMPVIEAMALGVPVLCGDAASLREVAGGAAQLFDPRDPDAIATAIAEIERDGALRQRMIEAGLERVRRLDSPETMARRYWDTLCQAFATLSVYDGKSHL
jgi:glycosyltransferase involved in cell wall biosynthesis